MRRIVWFNPVEFDGIKRGGMAVIPFCWRQQNGLIKKRYAEVDA